jgi:4-hydroxy-tetrahydrodipicolinate synthase
MAQTNVLNRMQWKYQAWLNGFNGGPMRQPSMRVTDPSMATLHQGLARSGIKPTELPDREFYIGRNPVASAAAVQPATGARRAAS